MIRVGSRSIVTHNRLFFALKIVLSLMSSLLFVGCGFGFGHSSMVVYGSPRTFQVDAVVGHNDGPERPSHFEVTNLHGTIEVIEFPGGDASRSRVYMGPQLSGADADHAAVALSFLDLTRNGRVDMVIQAQNSQVVFLNDGEKFVAASPDEEQQLLQRLRQLDGN